MFYRRDPPASMSHPNTPAWAPRPRPRRPPGAPGGERAGRDPGAPAHPRGDPSAPGPADRAFGSPTRPSPEIRGHVAPPRLTTAALSVGAARGRDMGRARPNPVLPLPVYDSQAYFDLWTTRDPDHCNRQEEIRQTTPPDLPGSPTRPPLHRKGVILNREPDVIPARRARRTRDEDLSLGKPSFQTGVPYQPCTTHLELTNISSITRLGPTSSSSSTARTLHRPVFIGSWSLTSLSKARTPPSHAPHETTEGPGSLPSRTERTRRRRTHLKW